MVKKRSGNGGNSSRNPGGNLKAQDQYRLKTGKATKRCQGFLHFDQGEVPVGQFRQATRSGSGLQSRCDVCNRLYFAIIQKPKVRALAIVIWAQATGRYDWEADCPASLIGGIKDALQYWLGSSCLAGSGCRGIGEHADFRTAVGVLTSCWSGLEKGAKDSTVRDPRTGVHYPAPLFMSEMQQYAAAEDGLLSKIDVADVWAWWSCEKFPEDTAICSAERRALGRGEIEPPLPRHPLVDFPWGSGNILATEEGHTVPGFNQVKAGARAFKVGRSASGRVYEYLVQGNRNEMAKFSQRCKADGLTVGHTPAPLRWLGKHDVVNAVPEPASENIPKRDSLDDLFRAAKSDPIGVRKYVSWQVQDLVQELGTSAETLEQFTQKLQDGVEEYLNKLADAVLAGDFEVVIQDLERAEPGLTETEYEYRLRKVSDWLTNRPGYRSS